MEKINTSKTVFFYDGRNKHDVDFRISKILYQADNLCLCNAVPIVRPNSRLAQDMENAKTEQFDMSWWTDIKEEIVLFNTDTGEVLVKKLNYWCATNDATVLGHYEDATKVAELGK